MLKDGPHETSGLPQEGRRRPTFISKHSTRSGRSPTAQDANLFRFKPKPAPPRAAPPPPPKPVDVAPAPTGPPPPPPIALKFIGIIDAGQSKKVVAVLSDGRGAPVYASEGETILGQYRILRIGTESIELSYLDGRGRQTIRFTGS